MKIISQREEANKEDTKEQMVIYFAINTENTENPFILGAYSKDLPGWGSASSFNLKTINNIDGTLFRNWRESLTRTGCGELAIPIFEDGLKTGDQRKCVETILRSLSQ